MGICRLGLAAIAVLSFLVVAKPEPARAGSAEALAALQVDASARPLLTPAGVFHHSRRAQSFYCYPKNYWWFYRPYTTGQDGHARCMPYFHYPSYDGRGQPNRYVK